MLTDKELETIYIAYLNIYEADETPTGQKVAEGLRRLYNKYAQHTIQGNRKRDKEPA